MRTHAWVVSTISALLVVHAVPVSVSAAVEADTRPCVTAQEYRAVRDGWRPGRVAQRFDTAGVQIAFTDRWSNDVVRKYRKCSAWGPGGQFVGVGYRDHGGAAPDRRMRAWVRVPHQPEQLFARLGHRVAIRTTPAGSPCVTQREFRRVHAWTIGRVVEHLGTRGREKAFGRWYAGEIATVWQYRKCSPWGPGGSHVGITYDNFGANTFSVDEKVAEDPGRLVRGLWALGH